jgi:hypothetical protein
MIFWPCYFVRVPVFHGYKFGKIRWGIKYRFYRQTCILFGIKIYDRVTVLAFNVEKRRIVKKVSFKPLAGEFGMIRYRLPSGRFLK